VVDLEQGRVTLALDRRIAFLEQPQFPLEFVQRDGGDVLVHGTDWNRIDMSDPATGALLSPRPASRSVRAKTLAPHFLDFWHGMLVASPGGRRIADNGWVWRPRGALLVWDVDGWASNVWETEDGPSRRWLCSRRDHWDTPCCWIDDERLVVWGFEGVDGRMTNAASVFNVVTGREEWGFPGPDGELFFDEHLIAVCPEHGTAVWQLTSGDLLFRDPELAPVAYHPDGHAFVSVVDGGFRISRLEGGRGS
jgi:hypothetical protein